MDSYRFLWIPMDSTGIHSSKREAQGKREASRGEAKGKQKGNEREAAHARGKQRALRSRMLPNDKKMLPNDKRMLPNDKQNASKC